MSALFFPTRAPMLRNLLLVAGLLGAGFVSAASLATPDDEEKALQATSMRLVQAVFTDGRYSLRARPLEQYVEPTFSAYVDALDPQRMYLNAADLEELGIARAGIRDAIKGVDLEPAFTIFGAYAARVAERSAFARARLAEPADYSAPGTWVTDRSALPRAVDQEALDEVWRGKVRNDRLELYLSGQSEDSIRRTLDARYAGLALQVGQVESMDVFGAFANAFAVAADPAGFYYTPGEARSSLQVDASLVGVGIVLKRDFPFAVIQSVVPGGPADIEGVRPGERLLALAQEPDAWTETVGVRLDGIVLDLRGKAGTKLWLRLGSASGEVRELALVRASVKLADEVAAQSVITVRGHRIGVITLPAFYADFEAILRGDPDARAAVADVAALLDELKDQDVQGVLLDLRGNGGGALMQGVGVAGLFLGRRPVVQIRQAGGEISVEAGDADAVWTGPLAVLVDSQSAAASEIVAAALQDHGRAAVLGERTFARGSVQSLVDLGRMNPQAGGLAQFTVADFFRVDGRAVESLGVEPDLPLPDAAAVAPRAAASAGVGRIPAAPGFQPPAVRPRRDALVTVGDPMFTAWRARWQRAQALQASNAVALDAPTRRAAIARERADAEAASVRDDALQAAAAAFSASLDTAR
ncbi:MAG: S41 family peptidase [Arenimonas sp.]|nr:S41 family peptidase [Arenimonas sp.]